MKPALALLFLVLLVAWIAKHLPHDPEPLPNYEDEIDWLSEWKQNAALADAA